MLTKQTVGLLSTQFQYNYETQSLSSQWSLQAWPVELRSTMCTKDHHCSYGERVVGWICVLHQPKSLNDIVITTMTLLK